MVPTELYREKMAQMLATMRHARDLSAPEATYRNEQYRRALRDLYPADFAEACDRLIWQDDWFPTVARIREVAAECKRERLARAQARSLQLVTPGAAAGAGLVCASCHGARWVRHGGYDPLGLKPGDEASRAQPCPGCTTNGAYDQGRERDTIGRYGGVPNPTPARPDVTEVRLPDWLLALRDPATGKIDMERFYRLSRELRGLDPDVDERPRPVRGFRSAGEARVELTGATTR